MPNTVRLHRVLATKPEKVYRAFIEADALAKWLPPNGFACTVHQLNAKVGGTFRMSFRNFTTGNNHSFGGEYIELVPHERLPSILRPPEVLTEAELAAAGAELKALQRHAFEVVDPESR